jgi:predicted Ser/Thr protein kinase
MTFVTDDAASDALEWMVRNAKALGKAKEQAVLAESMTKRIKALEMSRSDAKTVAEKERDALASEAYLLAIQAEAQAAGEFETLRALKDAATARIECWRSLTASQRSLRAA